MTSATTIDLVRDVASAHGAASLAAADHVAVSFSSGGLAFTAKRQPDALRAVEARLSLPGSRSPAPARPRGPGRSRSPTAPS